MCVVQMALVLIVKNIICLLNRFELDLRRFSLRFGDFVWMAR